MPTYTVQYEIEVDADTPIEAAIKIRNWLRDPKSYEPQFEVIDETGGTTRVDLMTMDLEEDE